ncbi:PTS system, cellobiose-specific IIC component [Granulicatella balaenopterae]|uniref:Permease IIC component n=1 Tax=Granulicatella balaenopterae TaxID=137733 RepID=A0A1H9LES0_9LACT|nr:PTS transporter subunit EIIC [Granulicatella balaenopterae]SER09894.1 PTS system, cellobiose-specific IIC component [Granulicatella balaenopterae]
MHQVLEKIAEKTSRQPVLLALRDGFAACTPLLIVTSLLIIIRDFPVPGYAELMAQIFSQNWQDFFTPLIQATYGVIALLAAFGVGYAYSREKKIDPFTGATLAVVVFLLMSQQVHPDYTNQAGEAFIGFSISQLNSNSLFMAMLCGLSSVELLSYTTKKRWQLTLKPGIPPGVAHSVTDLIPSGICLVSFLVLRQLLAVTPYHDLAEISHNLLQAPLLALGRTALFEPIYQFLSSLFWFFGITGPAITDTIFGPIHLAQTVENLTAYQAGQPLPNIYTGAFSAYFGNFGGGGSTLALVIVLFTSAKSQRLKQVAKISLLPGIFGINEMVIFGVPIVLNPLIMIPFVMVPVMNVTLAASAMKLGLVPYTIGVSIPWTTPIFFSGWLATASIKGGLCQIVQLALGCLVYYPFVKALDRQYLKEE